MMKTQKKKLRPNKRRFRINQKQLTVDYMSNLFRPKYSHVHEMVDSCNNSIKVKKVLNSHFDLYAEVSNSRRSKAVRLTEKLLSEVKEMLPDGFEMPRTVVLNFNPFGVDGIGGYDRPSNTMFINSKYNTRDKMLKYLNKTEGQFANTTVYAPVKHELGHKYYYEAIEKYAKSNNVSYNEAEQAVKGKIADYVHTRNSDGNFLKRNLSKYAQDGYKLGKYGEIVAESFSVIDTNDIAKEIIELIGGM